jgi:hypothetical protein
MTKKWFDEGFIPPFRLVVILAGISSERRLRYEEKVLKNSGRGWRENNFRRGTSRDCSMLYPHGTLNGAQL